MGASGVGSSARPAAPAQPIASPPPAPTITTSRSNEWDAAFAGAVNPTWVSTRYTTSSRTGGKVNAGRATKLAASGLPEDLGLCGCGQKRTSHVADTGHPFTPAVPGALLPRWLVP